MLKSIKTEINDTIKEIVHVELQIEELNKLEAYRQELEYYLSYLYREKKTIENSLELKEL